MLVIDKEYMLFSLSLTQVQHFKTLQKMSPVVLELQLSYISS